MQQNAETARVLGRVLKTQHFENVFWPSKGKTGKEKGLATASPGTVISFRTGSIRRHAQVEKGKAINLSYASSSEPIRVDLMSQVHTWLSENTHPEPQSSGHWRKLFVRNFGRVCLQLWLRVRNSV